MFKTIGAALLIVSAFSTKFVAAPLDCVRPGHPGGHQPDVCTPTVIELPDLPRTPDQFCIGEPNYNVPVIRDPTINIPCAPSKPVIVKPGKPHVPVICDIKVPTTPTKPTLPNLPCADGSCGQGGSGSCGGQGGHAGHGGQGKGCWGYPTKPVTPVKC